MTTTDRRTPLATLAVCLLTAAGLLFMIGCEVLGFGAAMLDLEKVKAVYPLQDHPTLVLVDDPQYLFGGEALPRQIAHEIGFHLKNNKVVQQVVDTTSVDALAAELGDDWPSTPMDDVARRLQARQVIYVQVESVSLTPHVGLVEPEATVTVKVIDAVERKRLFPATTGTTSGGFTLNPRIRPNARDKLNQGTTLILSRQLASRVARDVSRLFYDWKDRPVGQPFED